MNIHFPKNTLLLASVFITGCAVLIIEIAATRILSPYYGNTIYTTSSVIGTVLAALSFGYYLGGIASDKNPHHRTFYSIIFIAGLCVILTYAFHITILSNLSLLFSLTSGPLIFSLLLFFIPTFFLGMLSPFAIKLNTVHLDNKVGQRSGEVFFWSTLGSIVGSLLVGFILIPFFGINTIINATGIFLSLWAIFGLVLSGSKDRKIFTLMTLCFVSEILLIYFFLPIKQQNVIYEKDGVYENIKITDGRLQGHPVRFLSQDKSDSAAMHLDSDELAYLYTRYYGLYKLINPGAQSAFVIGGGAYSIPKALLKDSPTMKVDVVEIEPSLYPLAKQYFNLKDNINLTNYTEDGRRLLSKSLKRYDIIVSDVYYSFFSIPIHFTTKEFFQLAKSRLSDNGVFVGNFAGSLDKNSPSFIFSEIKTFKSIFPNSYFFAVGSPQLNSPQNIIFMGISGSTRINFESTDIKNSKDYIINTLAKKNIDISSTDFTQYQEITDNFAPVEYMVSRVLNRWY